MNEEMRRSHHALCEEMSKLSEEISKLTEKTIREELRRSCHALSEEISELTEKTSQVARMYGVIAIGTIALLFLKVL